MAAEVTLRIERPDGFESLSDAEWTAKLHDAVRQEEESARQERAARGGRVLGRKAILCADPTAAPRTAPPRDELRPCLACRNKARRIEELRALVAFRIQRYAALVRFLAEERDVVFPHGTYRVRGVFRAAPPPPDLALSA